MANTWWLAYNGSDANNGTTRALAKATMVGVQALAGLVTNDFINVVAPITNPLPWSLFAAEADLKAGTKGTNFTTNPGQIIRGTDDFGNPTKAYLKAASGDANGARSWVRAIANTGFVILRDIIGDATEKTADGTTYFLARLRDTGSPDPGPFKMEGCGMLGANPGSFPSGLRDFFDIDTTGPPAGTEILWVYGGFMQNANQVMPASGTSRKTSERVLQYVDAGVGSGEQLYSQTLADSSASAYLGVINCTIYISVDELQPPAGIVGFRVNDLINAGTLDSYNNLVYVNSTNSSTVLKLMSDGVAGAKTGVTLAGTIGNNVLLTGVNLSASELSPDGWYEGVTDVDKDDATGGDIHPGDVVDYEVPEGEIFAHPTSTFAWDALGNGAQFIVPKDLRPILYLTAGIGGVVPGALPAFLPPTTDWPRDPIETPIVETLSWRTSVVTSNDGSTEQRMALRMQPRRRFEFSYLMGDEAGRRAEYKRRYKARGRVRVPFLPYATFVAQGSAVSSTKLFFDPARTDIRSNEHVVVYRPSTEESFVVELTTVVSDGANTSLPLAQALFATDFVVPSMEGFLDNRHGFGMSAVAGVARFAATIGAIRSSFSRPGSAAVIATFDSLNVLDRRPLSDTEVLELFDRHPVEIDNETGVLDERLNWVHDFIEGGRRFLIPRVLTPGEMDYWRDFLQFARGMREPFLMPTFREDLALAAIPGSGAVNIDVLTEDFETAYFPYDTYKRLRLEAPNGEVIYRKIGSVLTLSPTTQRLTLTAALPATSPWSGTFDIGFLNRVRLNSDDVVLGHYPMVTLLELVVRTTDTVSYDSFETSAHDGAPIEGFHFIGTQKSFRYTNAQQDVTINGLLYTAAPIKRGAIRAGTQDDDSLELELELPFDLELIQSYAFEASPPDLSVTVYRYHEDSNPAIDWIISWTGKVTGFSVTGEIARVRVPSIFEIALRGSMPSAFYHAPCNHVLFDARCKVVKATFTTVSTVTIIGGAGTSITVANDGVADSALKRGSLYLPTKGERRLILDNVANVITINYPFFNIDVADVANIITGCDHAYQGDCKNKHANTLNYGGFPYVPKDNPFEGNL